MVQWYEVQVHTHRYGYKQNGTMVHVHAQRYRYTVHGTSRTIQQCQAPGVGTCAKVRVHSTRYKRNTLIVPGAGTCTKVQIQATLYNGMDQGRTLCAQR